MYMNPQITNTQINNINTNQPQNKPIDSNHHNHQAANNQAMVDKMFQQLFQLNQFNFGFIDYHRNSVSNLSPVNTPRQLPQELNTTPIGMIDLQNIYQHQNTVPINAALHFQSQEEEKQKKIASIKNYMPVVAVKVIQAFAQQVRITDTLQNYKTIILAQQAQKVAKIMLKKVIKIEGRVRKNKEFLLLVFNTVNEKLNDKIKTKRMTQAHKVYFKVLDAYGQNVMNAAKKILIDAFVFTMTDYRIRLYAQTKRFKTDEPLKQQVLLDYLLEIKSQLREDGKISGRYV